MVGGEGRLIEGCVVCAGREEVELEKVEEDLRKKRAAKYEQRRKQVCRGFWSLSNTGGVGYA